jgi:hypothetical protein
MPTIGVGGSPLTSDKLPIDQPAWDGRLMTSVQPPRASPPAKPLQRWAALTALGIVFGDLGASPLYTLQTVVQATGGQSPTSPRR